MKKQTGILTYNESLDRIDVAYSDGTTEGGLHCGTCFDVKLHGRYNPTRIEKSESWYLVGTGLSGVENIVGLKIRI